LGWVNDLILGTVSSAGKTALNIGKTGLTGGFASRMALGAGIGAIGGLLTSDNSTMVGKMNSMEQGALLGGLAGAGISAIQKFAPRLIGRVNPVQAARKIGNAGVNLASTGMQAGAWALAHPLATAGMVGGGIAAYHVATTGGMAGSPTLAGHTTEGVGIRANYDQQAIASEVMSSSVASMGDVGSAQQMYGQSAARQLFMNSTNGLTLGLHRSRHG